MGTWGNNFIKMLELIKITPPDEQAQVYIDYHIKLQPEYLELDDDKKDDYINEFLRRVK